jgi:phage shock protein PspC (stress-responsive transcriptional regulator)
MNQRLYRSTERKIIGGVCGGLGEYFNIDPTWLRLAFVILALIKGLGLILYIIGWVVIPRHPVGEEAPAKPAPAKSGTAHSLLPGIILIAIGVLFLLYESFWWFDFEYVWPVVLIVIGGALLYRALEHKRAPDEQSEQEVVNESR